jgi:hypothetical protein
LHLQSQSQSYLTSDSQSAGRSWCQTTIRARDQLFFLFQIFLRQLRVCYFMAPSLTRRRVCNLLLLLGLASAVPLGSESRVTQDQILLSRFLRLPSTWRARFPCLYLHQGQGGPVIPTGTGFHLRRLLRLTGLRCRHSNPGFIYSHDRKLWWTIGNNVIKLSFFKAQHFFGQLNHCSLMDFG